MPKAAPFIIDMGKIAISLTGKTGLYSGGFCGCLGVIVVPQSGKGGLVAHILQGGTRSGSDKESYLLEAASAAIGIAARCWPTAIFDVILFRGVFEDDGSKVLPDSVEYPGLGGDLMNIAKVQSLLDLRWKGERVGDQLLFDPSGLKLFFWAGHLSDAFIDEAAAADERIKATATRIEDIPLTHAKRPMPCFTFE